MKDKRIDEFNLQFRIRINKILYDENIISLDIYQKMESYLISKLSRFKSLEEGVR